MHLRFLALEHFRNYARLELRLEARCHLFCGRNAQGKTNLLEAAYYLVTTKSPLATSDREVIAWDAVAEPIPYARLKGVFQRRKERIEIEATLMLEEQSDPSQTPRLRKQLSVNGVPRRAMDVLGQANAVLFMPEDIALVSGSPSVRRRYLDGTLCQIDGAYCRTLSQYNRAVSQRNALLKRVRDRRARPDELGYWDHELVTLGSRIMARRCAAIEELDRYAAQAHADLTGTSEDLALRYVSSLAERVGGHEGAGGPEAMAGLWRQALPRLRREEIARGVTVVGPHRDDLGFEISRRDAAAYGSRGQQRTAALALKVAEMHLMTRAASEPPILMLDDVASELDSERCGNLVEVIGGADQVLVTTTDLASLPEVVREQACVWTIEHGTARPYTPSEHA